ncbi:MAG: LysR family transcriptional regulator [Pseudobdellovibrionaceae bacterium]
MPIIKNNEIPSGNDLRYFQEIASVLNLSRAAERLGISQPTLSLSVARLEDQLQAKIFFRRSRGLSLTPAGEKLLKNTNLLLQQWQTVVSETKKTETDLIVRFCLGCHPSVGIYSLDQILGKIYSDFPEIEIHLAHDLSRIMLEQVISGELEFALVVNPVRHPDLIIHQLAEDEVCFWTSHSQKKDETLIYQPELHQTQVLINKVPARMFRRNIQSTNLEVILSLAQAGVGAAILPSRVAAQSQKKLHRINELSSFKDKICLVYRVDHVKSKSFMEIVKVIRSIRI